MPVIQHRRGASYDKPGSLGCNPALLSSYVVFLPDALDGRDAAFIGLTASGSNERGRFAPVWFRQGQQALEQVAAAEETLIDDAPMADGKPARLV